MRITQRDDEYNVYTFKYLQLVNLYITVPLEPLQVQVLPLGPVAGQGSRRPRASREQIRPRRPNLMNE